MTMQTLTVQPDHIRALMAVAPTKDIRHYLNGIHIETGPAGAIGVATCGATLLAVRLTDQPQPQGHLCVPAFWKLPTGRQGGGVWTLGIAPSPDNGAAQPCEQSATYTLEHPAGILKWTGEAGIMVNWRQVVPRSVDLTCGAFSGALMAKLHKAAGYLGSRVGAVVSMNGPNNAALVSFPGTDAVGAIMPMRSEMPTEPPAWLGMGAPDASAA